MVLLPDSLRRGRGRKGDRGGMGGMSGSYSGSSNIRTGLCDCVSISSCVGTPKSWRVLGWQLMEAVRVNAAG